MGLPLDFPSIQERDGDSIMRLLEKIFSVKNKDGHKIWTILGLKIKFKFKNIPQKNLMYSFIAEEIYRALMVQKLHTKTFSQYKFFHHNDSIAIFGCGPTIGHYKNDLKTINIALNKAIFFENIKFNYLFVWDYLGFKDKYPTYFEEVKKYKNCTKFYGKFLNPKLPSIPEFFDDESNNIKHFYSCQRYGLPEENQEIKIYPDIDTHPICDFMSVSFAALQFALYTQPKRIYLVGLDTALNGHYFDEESGYDLTTMLSGYNDMKDFVQLHYPKVEIISVNPVGLKGLFKDVYTQSYVDLHPELLKENIEIIEAKEKE